MLLLFNSTFVFSQDIIVELNGFKLRQFNEAVKNEFGKPVHTTNFDDGFIAEIYSIKPDSSAYVVFEYPNWNKEIIILEISKVKKIANKRYRKKKAYL